MTAEKNELFRMRFWIRLLETASLSSFFILLVFTFKDIF